MEEMDVDVTKYGQLDQLSLACRSLTLRYTDNNARIPQSMSFVSVYDIMFVGTAAHLGSSRFLREVDISRSCYAARCWQWAPLEEATTTVSWIKIGVSHEHDLKNGDFYGPEFYFN